MKSPEIVEKLLLVRGGFILFSEIKIPISQKKCDSYYQKKLTQIPKVKIKGRKTYKKTKTSVNGNKEVNFPFLIKEFGFLNIIGSIDAIRRKCTANIVTHYFIVTYYQYFSIRIHGVPLPKCLTIILFITPAIKFRHLNFQFINVFL